MQTVAYYKQYPCTSQYLWLVLVNPIAVECIRSIQRSPQYMGGERCGEDEHRGILRCSKCKNRRSTEPPQVYRRRRVHGLVPEKLIETAGRLRSELHFIYEYEFCSKLP